MSDRMPGIKSEYVSDMIFVGGDHSKKVVNIRLHSSTHFRDDRATSVKYLGNRIWNLQNLSKALICFYWISSHVFMLACDFKGVAS